VRSAFDKPRDDTVGADLSLDNGALGNGNQRAAEISFYSRGWPHLKFEAGLHVSFDSPLDYDDIGLDGADPQAVRPDHQHSVNLSVALDLAVDNVMFLSVQRTDMHTFTSEYRRKFFEMIETAAFPHFFPFGDRSRAPPGLARVALLAVIAKDIARPDCRQAAV